MSDHGGIAAAVRLHDRALRQLIVLSAVDAPPQPGDVRSTQPLRAHARSSGFRGREDRERQGWGQGLEPTGHGPTLSTRERAAPLSSTVSRPEPRGTLSSPDRHPSSGGSRTTLLRAQSDDPPSGADRRPSSGGRPTPSSGGSRTTLQRRQSDDPPAGAVRRPFCGASSGGGGAVVVLAGRQGSFPPSSSAMLWI